MINGIVYDYESIKVMLPTGHITTAEDVKYNWKRDVDVLNDKNGSPRGVVRKGGEGDFEMDMSLDQFETLNKSAAATGILGMAPFPVIITIGDGESPRITDKIEVKITEAPREWKKDSELRMSLKGKITAVPVFNGVPAYVPKV